MADPSEPERWLSPISTETADAIRKSVMVDPKTVEAIRRSVMVDPKTVEAIRRSVMVDPKTVEAFRKSTMVNPKTVEVIRKAMTVDPRTVEAIRKAMTIDPKTSAAIRNSMTTSPSTLRALRQTVPVDALANLRLESVDIAALRDALAKSAEDLQGMRPAVAAAWGTEAGAAVAAVGEVLADEAQAEEARLGFGWLLWLPPVAQRRLQLAVLAALWYVGAAVSTEAGMGEGPVSTHVFEALLALAALLNELIGDSGDE